MSAQPKALRLADELDAEIRRTVQLDMMHHNAAAELRRLQEENDAAHQVGIQQEGDLMKVEAQRDALLEALAVVLLEAEHTLLEPTRRKARAAIKAVEEGK